MIVVHHLENSRSQRVLWALEELGCDYEVRRYARDPVTMLAPASLKAVHPLGKSPVIVDGGRTIAESGAILEYLAGTYGDGALLPPAGTEARDRVTYFLHYAEGSLQPYLVMKLIFARLSAPPTPAIARPLTRAIAGRVGKLFLDPNIATQLAFCENELASRPWFAGNAFSAADIQMSFPLEAAGSRGVVGPRVARFLETIHARPAYRRALERGGPYTLGF